MTTTILHFPSASALVLCLAALLSLNGCSDDQCTGDACGTSEQPGGAGNGGDGGDGDGDGDDSNTSTEDETSKMTSSEDDTVPFGKACTDDAECGPGLCLNMPVMVGCTQNDCMDGEANAGACPEGWMCLGDAERGTACIKF
ncbi:MAG: hypothetical protein OXU20_39990 [Myxococcales bacterium]|nr:hypothetical protein [Myxococcales bacterium]